MPLDPTHAAPANPSARASDYDALADLFLSQDHARSILGAPRAAATIASVPPIASEGGPALRFPREATISPPTPNPARTPHVEALILGHLPVLAGAWVGQYAKHVAASTHEPVALLRVQEGQVSLDLVSPIGTAARAHSRVGALTMDPGATSLEDAIAAARRDASRWLIRVDEVHETDLIFTPGVQSVTLLTGADDAAVVSSYRTLKQLSRHLADQSATRDADELTLNIAILGADDARALQAEAKLREGARTFLATPLGPAAKVGKIGPGSTTTLYRGAATNSAAQTLAAALAILQDSPQHASRHTAQPAAPQSAVATRAFEPVQGASAPASVTATSHAPAATQPSALRLAPLVGLTTADLTCPYATNVELAWGPEGGLHLLAMHDPNRDPIRDLLAAASWANDHKALLTRLAPCACPAAFGPTPHLLTRDLPSARALLDTAIRVHVLVELKTAVGPMLAAAQAN
jgi:hypothetical protein